MIARILITILAIVGMAVIVQVLAILAIVCLAVGMLMAMFGDDPWVSP